MKISNSKKQLARIISENDGWRNGEFAAQDGDGGVGGYEVKPEWDSLAKYWWREASGQWFFANKIKNHHQTVLSRAEYFHLCPELGVKVGVTVESNASLNATVSDKPTIEQLAADYRNAKDYADRKQQEADAAKADVGVKMKALKLAGKEYGLLVSPITAKQGPEPELVIKVQVGDEVECVKSNVTPDNFRGMIGTVLKIDRSSTPYLVDFGRHIKIWCYEVKFIRRP